MTTASKGKRCRLHASRAAAIVCSRCGDHACAACVAGERCWSCARRGEAPSPYRPIPRSQYRRLLLWPATIVGLGVAVGGAHLLRTAGRPAPPSTLALALPTAALVLLLAGIALFLRNQHRIPGSTMAADRARGKHRELRERIARGEVVTVGEVEPLLPRLYAHPSEHAAALETLADLERRRGDEDRASLLREAARESGWTSH